MHYHHGHFSLMSTHHDEHHSPQGIAISIVINRAPAWKPSLTRLFTSSRSDQGSMIVRATHHAGPGKRDGALERLGECSTNNLTLAQTYCYLNPKATLGAGDPILTMLEDGFSRLRDAGAFH